MADRSNQNDHESDGNLPPGRPGGKAKNPLAPCPSKDAIQEGGGVKETLESILVAFILAFIFRAFIVEAFVIPTGSMAPTLMGAHYRFRCPDCAYPFAVNYSAERTRSGDDDTAVPDNPAINFPVSCPNCGLRIKDDAKREPAVVSYGDRILVLKYLYMNLPGFGGGPAHFPFGAPQRWDVVVFKSPTSPQTYDYSQNYIKRLIGLPGETIMVLDGDVYVKGPGAKEFQIQTKPKAAQDALWRIVYDNDYHPLLLTGNRATPWRQPWRTAQNSGWKESGRQFLFSGDGEGALFFRPEANPDIHNLTDYLAYDQGPRGQLCNPIHDLKLEANYVRRKGDGPLRLTLTKYDRTFTAEITPGHARLLMSTGNGQPEVLGEAPCSAGRDQDVHVEFENVDYQVTLSLDGKRLLGSTKDKYAPNIDALRRQEEMHIQPKAPVVAIAAEKQDCAIQHLKLWRDVYYTSPDSCSQGSDSHREAPHWASPSSDPPGIVLGNDEYFVLGDNSILSLDGRCWNEPIDLLQNENLQVASGRVPGRFMLGKAFFVYWPAGYRVPGVEFPLIPDFGDMRFIH